MTLWRVLDVDIPSLLLRLGITLTLTPESTRIPPETSRVPGSYNGL